MKTSFQFEYCCDVRFKKIYGKLIRSYKKQFGKKKFQDISIVATETIENFSVPWDYSRFWVSTCRKCRYHYMYHSDEKKYSIKSITLNIEI